MGLKTLDAPYKANIFYISQHKKEREGRRHPFIYRKHIKWMENARKKGLSQEKEILKRMLCWGDQTGHAVSVRCSHGYSK